ncbi:DNA-3-methyladenine glycosylase family protein [Teichococcus aerofrigidensis]
MSVTPIPPWARSGIAELCRRDPAFLRVEAEAGPLVWRTRPQGFAGLVRTLFGQQISHRAAGAIWCRYAALPRSLDPEGSLQLNDEQLRAAGLSRNKVAHLRSLAAACLSGSLRLDALPAMADDVALAHLAAQRGLGPWTAQVYLLFAEQRADIFPYGDVALAASLQHLRGLPDRPASRQLLVLSGEWTPWRSLAARLLWQHWRHARGRPLADAD